MRYFHENESYLLCSLFALKSGVLEGERLQVGISHLNENLSLPRTLRLLFWNFIWIDNVFLLRSYSQVTFKDDGLRGIEVQCPQKWIYPFEKACREKKVSGKLVNMLPTFISRWLMRVYKCVARKCYPRSDTLLLHELLDSRVKYSIYFWPKNRPFKNHIMLECELQHCNNCRIIIFKFRLMAKSVFHFYWCLSLCMSLIYRMLVGHIKKQPNLR